MSKSVENFLNEWSNVSKTSETSPRKRIFESFAVEISASARPNTVRVNSIFSLEPKNGNLKTLLTWLVDKANKHHVVLSAAAQPFGWNKDEMPQKDKLKEIFEKYGFEVKFEYPDGDGYEMIRQPK